MVLAMLDKPCKPRAHTEKSVPSVTGTVLTADQVSTGRGFPMYSTGRGGSLVGTVRGPGPI